MKANIFILSGTISTAVVLAFSTLGGDLASPPSNARTLGVIGTNSTAADTGTIAESIPDQLTLKPGAPKGWASIRLGDVTIALPESCFQDITNKGALLLQFMSPDGTKIAFAPRHTQQDITYSQEREIQMVTLSKVQNETNLALKAELQGLLNIKLTQAPDFQKNILLDTVFTQTSITVKKQIIDNKETLAASCSVYDSKGQHRFHVFVNKMPSEAFVVHLIQGIVIHSHDPKSGLKWDDNVATSLMSLTEMFRQPTNSNASADHSL